MTSLTTLGAETAGSKQQTAEYRSHAKYWCGGRSRQCAVLVETNGEHGRSGRVLITDKPARGIFTVTVEDLHSGDTGWYNCGINTPGKDPLFNVHLQVSDEPVSVPVLVFLSPTNVSCTYGSVSLSCESVQGSLPVRCTWHERATSMDSKISNNSQLDLHCGSFKLQRHQYYCAASNNRGTKSSEMVNVTVITRVVCCHYVTVIKDLEYHCETLTTEWTTTPSENAKITSNSTRSRSFEMYNVLN